MAGPTGRQSTVVGVVFIFLVGVIAVVALNVYRVDEFLKVWAVIGTLVGVATGAIPAFFFSADAANARAARAKAEERTHALLGATDPETFDRVCAANPLLFPNKEPVSGAAPGPALSPQTGDHTEGQGPDHAEGTH